MKIIGIYKITSPTGKIYIGQSNNIERRRSEYKSCCHKGKLQNSIKKHGFENHIFETLEECSIELLNERERHFQDFYDVLGPNGLNLKLTSTSDLSGHLSEEVKQKLRIFNTGKKHSEETREKCRIKATGYRHSEENKQKISKAHKGKVYTEEILKNKRLNVYTQDWRDKISKANKGNKAIQGNSSKKVINIITKEIFGSVKEASESIGMRCENLSNRLNKVNKKNNTNLIYLKDYKT